MSTVAFISNFGMNLQKLSLVKQSRIDPNSPGAKAEIRKWVIVWFMGMSGIVISAFGDTVALEFGSQSLVAPLSSLTLVANALIAKQMHGEIMTNRDYFATALIMVGCVLSVAFASHKDTTYCPEIIWNQFNQIGVLIYFAIIAVVVLGLMLFSRWAERVETDLGTDSSLYRKWGRVHRFSYAAISGICGAQSVLLMKILVELFNNWSSQSSQNGKFVFIMWQTYPLIACLATFVALQIYWLNMGLAKFDALSNVPVFQCLWMLFGVIGGGVFFREFSTFDAFQSFMFPLGVSFCITGVGVLSSREIEGEDKDSDQLDGDSDSDTDTEDTSSNISSPLISGEHGTSSSSSSSSTDASHVGNIGSIGSSTPGYDATDYPNRMELPEYDAVFYNGSMGLGLYPEIVKITHPQYERVQGMVKVWRVRDLPRVPAENIDGSTDQPGPAEKQGVQEDMMLVGINGESILRQRNTWRETLLRLMHTSKPMVLTFRVVPTGVGILSEQKANGDQPPDTPNSIRGSREIDYSNGAKTPNAFIDMIHAGQISLSENRKRSTDSRGNLRYGPKSTNGRLRYKKLHDNSSKRHRRVRSTGKSRSASMRNHGSSVDVLDAHNKLRNRPMMSGTLTMFHQPESIALGGRYVCFLSLFFSFLFSLFSFLFSLFSFLYFLAPFFILT
jgi:magnesium transporter